MTDDDIQRALEHMHENMTTLVRAQMADKFNQLTQRAVAAEERLAFLEASAFTLVGRIEMAAATLREIIAASQTAKGEGNHRLLVMIRTRADTALRELVAPVDADDKPDPPV